MHRRQFLRATAYTSLAALAPGCWSEALTSPAEAGTGPYGPLSATPDANGLFLPAGFRSRIVAVGGEVVPGTGYEWHAASDGAATFATADGGWVLVSNSELGGGAGGASALRFGPPDGTGVAPVRHAGRILAGTNRNCAGGPTPWGTWLSCEETEGGRVWECDPDGRAPGRPLDALGRFPHEAAAVDPETGQVYLTEDAKDCRLFRFTPAQRTPPGVRPDLDRGVLEVAAVDGGAREGHVSWMAVDPADRSTHRPAGSRRFTRLEGAWYHRGRVYVAATSLSEIYELEVATGTLRLLYERAWGGPLTDADNVTVHAPSGDLFVTEDHGNMEIVVLAGGEVAPVVRVHGHEGSEVTGPAFDPTGERLYFASQRGSRTTAPGAGVIYEVSGPFRRSGEIVRAAARQPAPQPAEPAPRPPAEPPPPSTTAPPSTTVPSSSSSTTVAPANTSTLAPATSASDVALRPEAAASPIAGSSAGGSPGGLVAVAGAGAAATAALTAKLARSGRTPRGSAIDEPGNGQG